MQNQPILRGNHRDTLCLGGRIDSVTITQSIDSPENESSEYDSYSTFVFFAFTKTNDLNTHKVDFEHMHRYLWLNCAFLQLIRLSVLVAIINSKL